MAGKSGYDVVFPSNHFMARQIEGKALKKLDKRQLPNWKHLNPVLLKALQTNDPGNEHGFPYLWGSTGIGYPSPEMMGKLFALEAMPLNVDRIRTRIWNKIRTGS